MKVLGLTGSIAMGKSTAAAMFRGLGVPVFDADVCVHDLLAAGGRAVPAVEAAFPGVTVDGAVDRQRLGARVFGDNAALTGLEHILHPMVRNERSRFLQLGVRNGRALVVLDIPLLFETGGERDCDAVAVVSAPAFIQMQRLLARPDMDRTRVASVLSRQMSDREKRRRADFVIPTGLGRGVTHAAIRRIIRRCRRGC